MQVLSAYSSALGMFMPPGATETLALKQSYLNLVPLLRQDIVTMADYLLADAGVSGLASSIAGELQGSTDAELKEAGDSLAEGIEAANRLREMGF